MPKGPKGQERPADVIGNAVRAIEIATGQRENEYDQEDHGRGKALAELGRKGGQPRAERMTAKERTEATGTAASARYFKR